MKKRTRSYLHTMGLGVVAVYATWMLTASTEAKFETELPALETAPACTSCEGDSSDGHEAPEDDHDHDDHADEGEEGHDDHEGEHDEHAENEGEHAEHADHEGEHNEDAENEDEHAGCDDEGLKLSEGQIERFGVEVREAGSGQLHHEVKFPGEIVFNEDRVAHIVPRAAGIVRHVNAMLGDHVKAGDTLAVIISSELAAAKIEYVAAETEVGCCQFDLPRAQAINDNAVAMLALLETSPSVEQLQNAISGDMGNYRSRLISAYAEFVLRRETYEREKQLMASKITSEGDFLVAEHGFKKAQAGYFSTRESVAYEVRQDLLETTREQQLALFEAEADKQALIMMGLSESEIASVLVAQKPAGAAKEHVCTDPNCKGCAADAVPVTTKPSEHVNLGVYEVKAPFDGIIVQKHITHGESLDASSEIFTVADTSSVWVDLTVYAKDLSAVKKGQDVILSVDHSGAQARGTIEMVTPFVDSETRAATARLVLDNRDGRWVPGSFVTGFVSTTDTNLPVVVPLDAVQHVAGKSVVFVEDEHGFEPVAVTLGRVDRVHVEIVSGLDAGTRYVAEGAFQLKSSLVTQDLDSHAGHGH
jgi:multidrug efflux pump subunit AcrA (membrane-fusion protein)